MENIWEIVMIVSIEFLSEMMNLHFMRLWNAQHPTVTDILEMLQLLHLNQYFIVKHISKMLL